MTAPSPRTERRRAPRALANFPIRFTNDADGKPAILRDISEIGLACNSPREVPEMTIVSLDFSLPGKSQVHQVTGAIVRCEALPDGQFDLAVYFTDVADDTRSALANFVSDADPAP